MAVFAGFAFCALFFQAALEFAVFHAYARQWQDGTINRLVTTSKQNSRNAEPWTSCVTDRAN
jgi:hypothetical protein